MNSRASMPCCLLCVPIRHCAGCGSWPQRPATRPRPAMPRSRFSDAPPSTRSWITAASGCWAFAENCWPLPPCPDSYVALAEQRRSHSAGFLRGRAPRAGAAAPDRRQHRTTQLVLSFAEMKGDIHHRPRALAGSAASGWLADDGIAAALPCITGSAFAPARPAVPALDATAQLAPLAGGRMQTHAEADCSVPRTSPPSSGCTRVHRCRWPMASRHRCAASCCTPCWRACWTELRDQSALLALSPEGESALIAAPLGRWSPAAPAPARREASRLSDRLLARECFRTLRVVRRRAGPPKGSSNTSAVQATERAERPRQGRTPAACACASTASIASPAGARLLLDYKTGAADRMKLHESRTGSPAARRCT